MALHHVGPPCKDGLHQIGDTICREFAVSIYRNYDLFSRLGETALDGRNVAQVGRLTQNARSGRPGYSRGIIVASVIYHEDLVRKGHDVAYGAANAPPLVISRNNYTNAHLRQGSVTV